MRFLLACLAALLLAGCYESNGMLLDASQSRQPITEYQDFTYGSDTKHHANLNPRSDGWYDYEEATVKDDGSDGTWSHRSVLVNYLESTNGWDVYVFGYWDDTEKAYVYGVLVDQPGGRWQTITPSCDPVMGDEKWVQSDADAAKQAGADLKTSNFEDVCVFTSADALFNAMRNVVATPGF